MAKRPHPARHRRRRRYAPPKRATNALFGMLEKLGLTDQVRRMRITQAWNEAVGPGIASKTQPLSFRRGVVLVKSSSAAWQNELTFLKEEIIQKLNATLGSSTVKELKVVSGKIDLRDGPEPPPSWVHAAPSSNDLDVAKDASQPIVDDEIRKAFEELLLVDRRAQRARGK